MTDIMRMARPNVAIMPVTTECEASRLSGVMKIASIWVSLYHGILASRDSIRGLYNNWMRNGHTILHGGGCLVERRVIVGWAGMLAVLVLWGGSAAASTSVVTLGQNLAPGQRQQMLAYFGVIGKNIPVIYVNNRQEHQLLSGIASPAEIGTRSISCAYVVPESRGYGIRVATHHITWVTGAMYANALVTAGVKNAKVVAAAPFGVSGTAALAGILIAYQKATGTHLSLSDTRTAAQEMVTTAHLGNTIHNPTQATQLMLLVKREVLKHHLQNPATIRPIVLKMAAQLHIHLSATDVTQITNLMVRIGALSLTYQSVDKQISGVERQLVAAGPIWNQFTTWLQMLWHKILGLIHVSWIDLTHLFA